jgi:hypothetical protein
MSRQSKLAVLRAKTDRDLLMLVQRELDRALALADVEATRGSPLQVQAEKALQTVMHVLPKMSGLTNNERRELNLKLNELRVALDRLPAETVQWFTA